MNYSEFCKKLFALGRDRKVTNISFAYTSEEKKKVVTFAHKIGLNFYEADEKYRLVCYTDYNGHTATIPVFELDLPTHIESYEILTAA